MEKGKGSWEMGERDEGKGVIQINYVMHDNMAMKGLKGFSHK